MAYPIVSAPYGLKPVNLMGGRDYAGSTRMIPIKEAYATSIYYGDVVGISSGAAIITAYNANTTAAVAAGQLLGVFVGAEWTAPSGPIYGKIRDEHWTASTAAQDAVAYVVDDPGALFKSVVIAQAQGSANTQANTGTTIGYMSPAFVGSNAFLIAGNAGSASTGNSAMGVSGGNPTTASSVAGNIRQTVGTGSATSPCLRVVKLVQETAVTVTSVVGTGSSAATTFTMPTGLAIQPGMQVIYNVTGSGAMPGDFATVVSYVTGTGVVTTAANTTIPTGSTVAFVGYPEVIVGWNFGFHAYNVAAGA